MVDESERPKKAMPYPMRLSSLLVALLATAAAGAQSYSGQQDVSVDYSASLAGSQVLLYPGGQYGRIVRPLREPGEFTGPVKLRKPGKKAASKTIERPAFAPASTGRSAVAPPPPRLEAEAPPPVKAPPKRAAAPPPPSIRNTPQVPAMSGFGDLMVAKPSGVAKPAQAAKPPVSKPVRTAVIDVPAKKTAVENVGTRRGSIGFEANASDPSGTALQTIGKLADELNGTVLRGSTRVQLLAYAGPKGEKSSDSRRLSLKRALIVRQLLIDAGVPSDRIDVRAMGGADDNGAADRVDVLLKG
jgi:outer membrane protein OmpA-like peptidoglycan-associated protein